MYQRKTFRALITIALILVTIPIILIPLAFCTNILMPLFVKLGINGGSFLQLVTNYTSLSISVVFGIIVYYQSRQINEIEIKQQALYVAAEGLNYEFEFSEYITICENTSELNIACCLFECNRIIMANINLGEGEAKTILVPVSFITKNQALIIALRLKKLSVEVKDKNKGSYRNSAASTVWIKTPLENESHFVLCLTLVVPKDCQASEIQLNTVFEFKNQHQEQQMILSEIELKSGWCNSWTDRLVMTSSLSVPYTDDKPMPEGNLIKQRTL